MLNTVTAPSQDLSKRFSTLQRLTRTIAYCARFHHNTTKNPRIIVPLTAEQIQEANTRILKAVQGQEFATDITALTNKDIRYKGRLGTLNPVIDEVGLLRVGGRIAYATVASDTRHPIILPAKHHFTKLVIQYYHTKQLHAGAQATLNAVRQRYWPIEGIQAVKGVIRRCTTCLRANPKFYAYQMGNLPRARLTFERPFLISGVDFCGPFCVSIGKTAT